MLLICGRCLDRLAIEVSKRIFGLLYFDLSSLNLRHSVSEFLMEISDPQVVHGSGSVFSMKRFMFEGMPGVSNLKPISVLHPVIWLKLTG